ncbi:CRE-TAG-325 protein [Caenorhabditis remanei]|uniref:CRE-TAG-325 protein n=1 Tax=Caenorhabditis remanei TaxID=31234 RepID=E3MCR8_CAERE|nr:CRE-TAG-325 protein [Caenorhabditis remanei]
MTTAVQPSSEVSGFGGGPAGSRASDLIQFQEIMSESNESSSSSSHTNLTANTSNVLPRGSNEQSPVDDPSHVYTNIREIEELNSRPVPPTPRNDAQPRRDLLNGWYEYETDVGRTFFYNKETGKSQWIPPRFIRTPAQVQEFLRATRTNLDTTFSFQGTSTLSSEEQKENKEDKSNEDDRKSQSVEDEEVFDEICDVEEEKEMFFEPPSRPLPIPSSTDDEEDINIEQKSAEQHVENGDDGFSDSDFEEEYQAPTTARKISSASGAMIHHPYVQMSTFQSTFPRSKDEDNDKHAPYMVPPDANESTKASNPIRVRRPSPSSLRSVSFQNKCTVLKNVPMPQVLPTTSTSYDLPQYHNTPDRPSFVEDSVEFTQSLRCEERRGSSEGREPVRTIRCGDMERSEKEEQLEKSIKPKKKEWIMNYMYLTTAHLILYKDQKSAEKHGKHYDAPQGVWDLRGATVTWYQDDRDFLKKKQRKYIQLELCNTKKYLLRCSNDTEVVEWYKSLVEVVEKLPAPGSSNQAMIDVTNSIARNPSYIGSTRPLSHALIPISRSMRRRDDPMSQSAIESMSTSATVDESRPSKETILEKLRRFFRTRPTVESLKEKGIYKPEPVFGSTLSAICQHENSLVPKFIRVITEVIESKGLETDGIYRVSGNLSAVQKIRCQADQDNYKALVAEEDIHVLTGALKLFFRELSDPLFPISLHKEYTSAMQMPNATNRFKKFEELLGRLPNENRETLKMLLRHLNRVASHSSQNRMQQHNLAIVFGPTLFHNGDGAVNSAAKNKKAAKKTKPSKKEESQQTPIQSNSHLAFSMIMQSQIVQYLLESANKFDILKAPVNIGR